MPTINLVPKKEVLDGEVTISLDPKNYHYASKN